MSQGTMATLTLSSGHGHHHRKEEDAAFHSGSKKKTLAYDALFGKYIMSLTFLTALHHGHREPSAQPVYAEPHDQYCEESDSSSRENGQRASNGSIEEKEDNPVITTHPQLKDQTTITPATPTTSSTAAEG